MIAIGVLLLVAGATTVGFALAGGGEQTSVSWQGVTLTTTALGVFAIGALTLLVLEAGLVSLRRGFSRRAAERRELKRLRAERVAQESIAPGPTAGREPAPSPTPSDF